MNNSTYKAMTFSLNVTDGSGAKYTHTVHPSFDGITIKKAKESDECYFKETCSNKFYFKNEEFSLLYGYGIYAKFTLVIKKNGVEITRGEFRLTDCEVDANRKIITTSITIDKYAKLSKNKGTEYNLTKLKPATEIINYDIKPCIQIYIGGGIKIEQFSGRIHKSKEVSSYTELPNYCFGTSFFLNLNCTQEYDGVALGQFKKYFSRVQFTGHEYEVYNNTSTFKIKFSISNSGTEYTGLLLKISILVYQVNVGSDMLISKNITGDVFAVEDLAGDMTLNIGVSEYVFTSRTFIAFFRLLSSNKDAGDVYKNFSTVDTNSSNSASNKNIDVLYHGETYTGAIQFSDGSISEEILNNIPIVECERESDDVTQYGRIEDSEKYYDKPLDMIDAVPVYQEGWADGHSFWIDGSFMDNTIISNRISLYSYNKSIGDFYRIGSVIKKLLEKVDDEIIFDEDEAHSQFLFRETNPITKNWQCPQYITQKSNILTLSYNRAAWKVPCTLEKIFEFLKYAFNCYYDIYLDNDGNKHLRIEHVIFYENGLYYDENNQLSTIDAGAIVSPYNGKKSSYMSKNWKYDTTTQASTIELSWMDKQSDYFDGSSIETKKEDNIYSEEKTDKKQITFFSSDIDFLILDTSAADKDGFLVVQPNATDPHKVPTSASVNGYQNYLLAFSTLVPNFLLYYLYQKHVTFNDNVLSVVRRKKMKTSELEINIPKGGDIGEYTIIKTEIGDGTIESVETDYSCNHCKIELKYETE